LVGSNQPAGLSNLVVNTTGITVTAISPTNDPIELELQKVMEADDNAQAEVDGWIRENQEFAAKGAAIPNAELNQRIVKRFSPVRSAYEDLIKRHPENGKARIAFASFLHDMGEEDAEAMRVGEEGSFEWCEALHLPWGNRRVLMVGRCRRS